MKLSFTRELAICNWPGTAEAGAAARAVAGTGAGAGAGAEVRAGAGAGTCLTGAQTGSMCSSWRSAGSTLLLCSKLARRSKRCLPFPYP